MMNLGLLENKKNLGSKTEDFVAARSKQAVQTKSTYLSTGKIPILLFFN